MTVVLLLVFADLFFPLINHCLVDPFPLLLELLQTLDAISQQPLLGLPAAAKMDIAWVAGVDITY